MIIDATQLRIARCSLDMSMHDLARASGLSASGISQIERTGGFQAATMRALQQALAARGALSDANGGVGVSMEWPNGRPTDKRVREGCLAILNASPKAAGKAPLIDCEYGR